jgi:hypothetical protein
MFCSIAIIFAPASKAGTTFLLKNRTLIQTDSLEVANAQNSGGKPHYSSFNPSLPKMLSLCSVIITTVAAASRHNELYDA